jgi:excisionase family DNA binding protein
MPADISSAGKPATSLPDFDLLTIPEVAVLLHCSKAHISHVIAGHVAGCPPIPAVRLGRRTLIRRGSLASWIEQNDKITTSPERGRKGA